jgi:hypothetical protein
MICVLLNVLELCMYIYIKLELLSIYIYIYLIEGMKNHHLDHLEIA